MMIACLSPTDTNHEESLSTLKYAHNTKFINNRLVTGQQSLAHLINGPKFLARKKHFKLICIVINGQEQFFFTFSSKKRWMIFPFYSRPVVNDNIDPKDEIIKGLQHEIKQLRNKLNEWLLWIKQESTTLYTKEFSFQRKGVVVKG